MPITNSAAPSAVTGARDAEPPAPVVPYSRARGGAAHPDTPGQVDNGQDGLFHTLNAFVGRRDLLAKLRGAIETGGSRLVTLTGGPGAGKTRLAKEYATQVQHAYEHGVRFVDLRGVPTGDTALLEQTLMSALRVPSQSAQNLRASLLMYLRERRMLVILDNCEHLVEEVGDLAATLLHGAPQLRVLTTSRTLLELDGEALIMVPPLALPDQDGPLDVKVESVQLLVQRARTGVPGWTLTQDNWPPVRRILHHFGGLPLGIELVVGQMRSLSLDVIAARLDNAPHQRTLDKVIRPSYDLCSPAEQRLLAAAAAFTGGFGLQAAEHVCADDELPESEVAQALAGLVDKSLVVPSPDRTRYELLEPIRQFAAKRLRELPEQNSGVRGRHRAFYRQLAAEHAAGFRGPNEIALLQAVERDMPNIRAALGSLVNDHDPACALQGLQMAVDVSRTRWWSYSGRLPEQALWLTRALDAAPASPSMLRASAICLHAWMMLCLGDGPEAVQARIADAEAMAPTGEPVAALLFIQGTQMVLGDGDPGGLDLLYRSHRLWQSYGPDALVDAHLTEIMVTIGMVLLGDAEEGRRAAADFLAECQRLQAQWGMAWARWCQAVALIRFDDDPHTAVRVLLDSVRGQREIGDRWTPLFTLPVLAWALARGGRRRATAAARLLGAADGLHQITGIQLSRKLTVFARLRAHAEAAVSEHLSPKQYAQAYTVQVSTVEDVFALVLDDNDLVFVNEGDEDAAGDHRIDAEPAIPAEGRTSDEGDPLLHPNFTPTEDTVARHVMAGLTNKQIAAKIFTSSRTVESHVSNIYRKANVPTRTRVNLVDHLKGLQDDN